MRPEEIANTAWHSQSPEDALALLEAKEDGLSEQKASERRTVFGPNRLPKQKRPGLAVIYLHQFKSPLIYLLLAAALIGVMEIFKWARPRRARGVERSNL